jgi:hypothetical protein
MSGRGAKRRRQSGHPARQDRPAGSGAVSRKPPPKSKGTRAPSQRRPRRATAPRLSPRRVAGQRWLASSWTKLRERQWPARPLTPLERADWVWAGATGLISAVLFATELTGHPYLGDAPETVSGVSSLGILHSPGYPAYVLAAHLFTLLIPVGSEAFAVNLFSLVCGALTIAGVQLLARRCGIARWAASAGALTLAASAGFWFYTGFAKHDLFSGLLMLITLHLALACWSRPTTGRLCALAASIALGLGSSWPLEMVALPAVGLALIAARRSLSLRSLAAATATGLVLVVGLYGFVMIRASENPPVNWGDATTLSRLWDLVDRADFLPHGSTQGHPAGLAQVPAPARPGPEHQSATTATITPPAAITADVSNYATIFSRELGVVAVLLAALGVIASLGWRRNAASYLLLALFLTNLLAARYVVGFGSSPGSFNGDLIEEGFVLGSYFAFACWVAIGAHELVAVPREMWRTHRGSRSERSGPRGLAPAWVVAPAALAVAAVLVIPQVLGHRSTVDRSNRPFAQDYAASAFNELPRHAALFILGAELTQPLIYEQVVNHERPDIEVVAADGLEYPWYREQISRRLGVTLPPATGNSVADVANALNVVTKVRPVYLDPQAAQLVGGTLGYRPVGVFAALVPGHGQLKVSDPEAVQARLVAAEQRAGLPNQNWSLWPNDYLANAEYATAALHLARSFYQRRDYAGMRRALLNDLSIDPSDPVALSDLAQLHAAGVGG